jgi:8-oxo-dGTP pyrophosphatase MutT (NUDIX family)
MNDVLIHIVTAIIERDGKYLLLKRSETNRTNKNKWQFLEGKIEFEEKPLEVLKREIKEGAGLELLSADFLDYSSSVVDSPDSSTHLLRLFFKCNVSGEIKLSEEHSDWGFFSIWEIEKIAFGECLDLKEIKKILKV